MSFIDKLSLSCTLVSPCYWGSSTICLLNVRTVLFVCTDWYYLTLTLGLLSSFGCFLLSVSHGKSSLFSQLTYSICLSRSARCLLLAVLYFLSLTLKPICIANSVPDRCLHLLAICRITFHTRSIGPNISRVWQDWVLRN